MQKSINKLRWSFKPIHQETPFGVSLTQPDDSMTIKEIFERFTTGAPMDDSLERKGLYDENASFDSHDLDALARMDVNERQEFLDILREDINSRKADLKAARAAVKAQESAANENQAQKLTDDLGASRQQHGVQKAKGSRKEPREAKDESNEDDGDRGS